jgi:hypothetical protein
MPNNNIENKIYILEKSIENINRTVTEIKENIIIIKYFINTIIEQNKKIIESDKLN